MEFRFFFQLVNDGYDFNIWDYVDKLAEPDDTGTDLSYMNKQEPECRSDDYVLVANNNIGLKFRNVKGLTKIETDHMVSDYTDHSKNNGYVRISKSRHQFSGKIKIEQTDFILEKVFSQNTFLDDVKDHHYRSIALEKMTPLDVDRMLTIMEEFMEGCSKHFNNLIIGGYPKFLSHILAQHFAPLQPSKASKRRQRLKKVRFHQVILK